MLHVPQTERSQPRPKPERPDLRGLSPIERAHQCRAMRKDHVFGVMLDAKVVSAVRDALLTRLSDDINPRKPLVEEIRRIAAEEPVNDEMAATELKYYQRLCSQVRELELGNNGALHDQDEETVRRFIEFRFHLLEKMPAAHLVQFALNGGLQHLWNLTKTTTLEELQKQIPDLRLGSEEDVDW